MVGMAGPGAQHQHEPGNNRTSVSTAAIVLRVAVPQPLGRAALAAARRPLLGASSTAVLVSRARLNRLPIIYRDTH